MNQKIGTQPLKKVGPAVPPKPKKPQPQVPKSYQLSGACEPSFSVPLQTTISETKRPDANSGPVYSNILPVSEPSDNMYSNIGSAMPMQPLYSNLEHYSKAHLIEDPDAFKTWLTSEVKSMIEADPVALAKYIYALVKKNKPLDELREKAVSQLEVFFKERTVSFVDMLFHTIATKSYITSTPDVNTTTQISESQAPVMNIKAPIESVSKCDEPRSLVNDSSDKVCVEKTDELEASLSRNEAVTPFKRKRQSPSPLGKYRRTSSRSKSPRPRSRSKSPRPRSRSKSPRPRSRSKSPRPRSRSKSPRPRSRSKSPRPRSRSKSPLTRSRSKSLHSRSRSRSRSKSWERRNKYRRSPTRKLSHSFRYRKFSNDRKYYSNRRRSWSRSRSRSSFRSRSRSRSCSYSPRRSRYKHKNRNPSPLSPLFRKTIHEDNHKLRHDLFIKDPNTGSVGSNTTSVSTVFNYSQKERCVDFDEKGFCMRGDMCPYDHGVNPVVLEPSSVPLLPIQQHSTTVTNPKPYQMFDGTVDFSLQYNPTSIKTNLSQWVSQKIIDDSLLRQCNENESQSSREKAGKPRGDVFSRLGPKPVKEEVSKCTLEITNIPPKLNTITLLFNHFSKFGNVVNIKVKHKDDASAALVTFSKEHEAAAAFRSPAPVMRNRFIKVTLHNEGSDKKADKEENVPPVQVLKNEPFKVENKFKKELKPTNLVLTRTNALEQKKKVMKATAVKKKKIEAKQITANLLKLKQELLEEQIAKQKLLIEKLEKGQYGVEDKNSILSTIKILDASIKEIKSSLASSVNKLKAANAIEHLGNLNPVDKKSKSVDIKRKLLDAELDLFTAKQKGSDSSEIEKKILALKKQLMVLDSGNALVSAPLRRSVPVLPNVSSLTIDHRPTKLFVQNFDPQNKGAIITHLSKFGELKVEEEDDLVPSLLFSFKTHKEADLARNKSKLFFGDKITISFCNQITGGQ